MIIKITPAGTATLEDIDNFRAFNVTAACEAQDLSQALTGLGRLDAEGNAWISRAWLLVKGRSSDTSWLTGFEAMLSYARDHGWVDSATDSIRAHVEFLPS
jgi:hypothetical protein